MSFIKENSIARSFGGAPAREAAALQADATSESQRIFREQSERARGDVLSLFPAAEQNSRNSFQGALDIFGSSIPEQLRTQQAGNVGAQEALLAGLNQQQNAILGGNIDLSGLQPQQIQGPAKGFFSHQLPDFVTSAQALAGTPNQQTVPPQQQGGGGDFSTFQQHLTNRFGNPSQTVGPGFLGGNF